MRSTSTSSGCGQLGRLGAAPGRDSTSSSSAGSSAACGSVTIASAAAARRARPRPWRARRRPPQQDRALAELAAEVGLAELDLARELVAPAGEEVDPGLDRPLRAPRLLDGEGALPAHAVMSGRRPAVSGDSRQRALARPAPAHDGAQHLVAVTEDVRRDLHRVGHGALDRPAAAVDRRRRVLDPDAVRRLGLGSGGHVHPSFPHATSTNQRLATASHLVAGREAWRIRVCVRRLARGRGPVVVAGPAARPAQPPALALQGGVRLRRVARVPGRARRAGVGRRARGLPRPPRASGSTTGRAFAGATRAINDQVRFEREWTALRAYARERGVRLIGDVPIYVAPGSADDVALARAVPRRRRGRASRPTRSRTRASCGATRSTTGPRCAAGATAGGSSACGAPSTSSTSRASTTSAASRPTGRCRAGARDALGGRWVRGPGRAVFDAARAELRRLPLIAEDLGVDHARRHAPARVARPAGDGRAAVRLQPARARAACTAPSATAPGRCSTPARTTTTRCAAGTSRCRPSVGRAGARGRRRRARAVVGLDGARALLEGAAVHAPGPGRARPGLRGAHERAGGGRRAVALAAARWAAHAGVGAAVAAAHRGAPGACRRRCGAACAYSITEGKESAAEPGAPQALVARTAWDWAAVSGPDPRSSRKTACAGTLSPSVMQ